MTCGKKVHDRQDPDEEEDHEQAMEPHPRRSSRRERPDGLKFDDKNHDEDDQSEPFAKRDKPDLVGDQCIRNKSRQRQCDADGS